MISTSREVLAQVAVSIRLEVSTPPCPEHSRLDDWFLGGSASHNCVLPQFLSSCRCMRRSRCCQQDIDKVRFLVAPISQAGLFGDTVEEQFLVVQKQTVAIKHHALT